MSHDRAPAAAKGDGPNLPINRKYAVKPRIAEAWVVLRREEGAQFGHGFEPALITELSALALTRLMAAFMAERARGMGITTDRHDLLLLGFSPEQIDDLFRHARALAVSLMVGTIERDAKQLAEEFGAPRPCVRAQRELQASGDFDSGAEAA